MQSKEEYIEEMIKRQNAYFDRYTSSPHARANNIPGTVDGDKSRKSQLDLLDDLFSKKYRLMDGMVADKLRLYQLIFKWKGSGGLRIICGKAMDGTSCLFEFEYSRHGTGRLSYSLDYLPPRSRHRNYYIAGDIILCEEAPWSTVCSRAKIKNSPVQSGVLKLLLTVLRGCKAKTYKFGYIIVNIEPNGNGTGSIELQAIVFSGGIACPVGRGQNWAVNYNPQAYVLHRDINTYLEQKHTSDGLKAFADDLTIGIQFVTDVASGGLKKILTKGGAKIVYHLTWKHLLKEITKRVVKKLPVAALAFTLSCMTEIAKIFDDKSLNPTNKMKYEFELSKKINAPGIPKKILIVAFSKFISVLLAEASSATVEESLPAEVITNFSEILVINFLKVGGNSASIIIPNLIKEYGNSIDPKTGKLDNKKQKSITDNFLNSNKTMFSDSAKSLISNLIESIM
ncbi:MAG: hypothetical protein L3J28_12810 [Candidatus Polarisedimenticolaceae bacterium]|nr:hypothetical protein [Candidatus Polarisedimenticolaceae bacterium]